MVLMVERVAIKIQLQETFDRWESDTQRVFEAQRPWLGIGSYFACLIAAGGGENKNKTDIITHY